MPGEKCWNESREETILQESLLEPTYNDFSQFDKVDEEIKNIAHELFHSR